MEDIRKNGRVLDSAIQCVNRTAVKGGRLFPANSFLVATTATIGEHALVTVPHLSNQQFTSLSLKPDFVDKYDTRYLFHYLYVLSDWCKKNVTTSSFAAVDMTGFRKFAIPEPPLEVQREIARILDKFSALEAELKAELKAELDGRKKQCEYYRNSLLTFESSQIVNTVDELVQQHCPEGVGYAKIGDVLRKVITPNSVPKGSYTQVGKYPIVSQAQGLIAGYSDDETKVLPNGSYVVFGDHTRAVKWVDFEFIPGESGTLIFKAEPGNDPKYVYYCLKNASIESRGYNRHWTVLREIPIQLPPIEIQKEIVRVLDKFTALEAELETELETELAARRKQYEYYREQLLTFKELKS